MNCAESLSTSKSTYFPSSHYHPSINDVTLWSFATACNTAPKFIWVQRHNW